MKQKLLIPLLIVLLITNLVMLFMLIKKPHEMHQKPERDFLISELKFDENQTEKYRELDEEHHQKMRFIEDELRFKKDKLFTSFEENNTKINEITKEIGELEADKGSELFRFFNSVRALCNESQKEKFDKIINKALKGGMQKRGRGESNRPPPRNGKRPPAPR